jgi:hypothetical protein
MPDPSSNEADKGLWHRGRAWLIVSFVSVQISQGATSLTVLSTLVLLALAPD